MKHSKRHRFKIELPDGRAWKGGNSAAIFGSYWSAPGNEWAGKLYTNHATAVNVMERLSEGLTDKSMSAAFERYQDIVDPRTARIVAYRLHPEQI